MYDTPKVELPEFITSGVSSTGFFLTPSGTPDNFAQIEISEEGYKEAARRWNVYQALYDALKKLLDRDAIAGRDCVTAAREAFELATPMSSIEPESSDSDNA